jgi:5-methylcytosine-specific restriction enzyme A
MLSGLDRSIRSREYNQYPSHTRGRIAFEFLTRVSFKHREIDKEILGLDPLVSRGWQSMGILHFQGLKHIHSGALEGYSFEAVVDQISNLIGSGDLLADLRSFGGEAMAAATAVESEFVERVEKSLLDSAVKRRTRLSKAGATPPTKTSVTTEIFNRNPDVVAEALLRAAGVCEHCKKQAPFLRRRNNQPYLEVHHTLPLAQGGLDVIANVSALCPNCHRKAHYG